ncbi:MAG: tetratricopeptide repeat protein [Acidobacteria bacterium]|nr:tetratricopeptide repeat protein [Acidobacteriota bacterium]MBP7474431.1 tetratricopeptide repeat protein [Pyrinomonadaceae bacterium]MBP9109776.1 tetratricopeptide repeat protein [Pyrinomonadaceae bacterium]
MNSIIRKRTYLLVIMIWFAGIASAYAQKSATSTDKTKMELTHLIFDRLGAQGVNTNKPLLYGYFFFDRDKAKLERLAANLIKQNYSLVRLERNDDGVCVLHVEKTEAHSVDSLLKREEEFRVLASRFMVATYDGWDVGNADPTKPLVSNDSFRLFMDSKKGNDLFNLGIRLYDLEVNDRAAEVFTECLKQKIKPDVSSFKLAVTQLELGKREEAIFHLEQAIKFEPKYVDAYFNLGTVYYDLGKHQKSLENLETADRLRPDDDATLYGMALNQYALGKFSQSRENCAKALKVNPKNENAKALLKLLQEK